MKTTAIGNSGLEVTEICFGASALGDMPDTYGYSVSEEQARATLDAIFDGPANFLDTSRIYGFGRSEERIGQAISARGGLPQGFVISTKIDRDTETNRLDADRSGGALDELFRIKEEGLADAVGLAMGRIDIMFPLLRAYPFDTLINHNRYTLLNRQADEMFDYAHQEGTAVLNAAPYASGVLAKGSGASPRITYQEADEAALAPVRQIEEICAKHQVPMGAVALQFSTRDERIASTLVGVSKPERVRQTLDWLETPIPEALWSELEAVPFSTEDPEATRDYKPG